jgi:DNA-directed RNA polymerase specialized sigma24 family protein
MNPVEAGLATLFASGTLTGLSDIELLERLASRGDRLAFEVLVGRHARLVLNVCRSLLPDPNDADDAFQATFLVLARKAGSIRVGQSRSSWLCRVAYRIAVRAGTESARRREVERRGAEHHAGGLAGRAGTNSFHQSRLGRTPSIRVMARGSRHDRQQAFVYSWSLGSLSVALQG